MPEDDFDLYGEDAGYNAANPDDVSLKHFQVVILTRSRCIDPGRV